LNIKLPFLRNIQDIHHWFDWMER